MSSKEKKKSQNFHDFKKKFTITFTGEKITEATCESPTFTVAWHPKRHLLAFACDDKDKYDRERDAGSVKLYGVPSDNS